MNTKAMEIWQHITDFTEQNACNSCPCLWNFRYLEITGQRCEISRNVEEICKRIPKLKIETKTRAIKQRVESNTDLKSKPSRKPSNSPKQLKERLVSIKVVSSKSLENLSRNCVCTCECQEELRKGFFDSGGSCEGQDEDVHEIPVADLLDIFKKYDKETNQYNSHVIVNLVRRFQGSNILHDEEVKRILKMLDTNNRTIQESLLMLLNYVARSSLTAKLLLQHDVLNCLIYLMSMGASDGVQLQAALCIAKLTELEDLSDLWFETMVISGTESLFDVLSKDEESVSEPFLNATLDGILNLANNSKMAAIIVNRFDLSNVIDLTRCKNDEGKAFGSPPIQRVATRVLTSLLSHSCEMVEKFLSKYSEAVDKVLDILQYSSCPQQQEAAQFLSILTSFPSGIDSVISHHATEHLLWAMTCSHCRFVRESASKAFRNITQHSEKAKVVSALEQFSTAQINQSIDSKRKLETPKAQPTTAQNNIKNPASLSKLEKTMVDVFSVLIISFKTDSLHLYGSRRTFIHPSENTANNKGMSTKGINEQYLSSLRVLVNILVAMATLIRFKDQDDNEETSCSFGNGANLKLVVLFVQCGGLQLLNQIQVLSEKLQRVNRPIYRGIDPTILPPKEIVSSVKNTRTELIFNASGQKPKPQKRYQDFGFHSAEILFIGQAVDFLIVLAQATAQDFDPAQENLNVFVNSRSPPALSKKKHVSFRTSSLIVRSAVRLNANSPRGADNKEIQYTRSKNVLKRQIRTRSPNHRTNSPRMDRRTTPTTQTTKPPSASARVEPWMNSRNELIHFVKQSLLAANVVSYLAVWITCGVHGIQQGVIKILRTLMHVSEPKHVASNPFPNDRSREAWASKTKNSSKNINQQRTNTPLKPSKKQTGKTGYLSRVCVRHVIQYCGAYLLDLLEPPATGVLGQLSLMTLREAVINGENDTPLKLVKLGCLSQVINYIRGAEDKPEMQGLGLVVVRNLVSSSQALKQLFLAHGGMSLVMALCEYKEGLVKQEAACTLQTFARASPNTGSKTKGPTSRYKNRSRTQASDEDIWSHVIKKWERQDKVAKLLTKFNVRY